MTRLLLPVQRTDICNLFFHHVFMFFQILLLQHDS